MPVKYPEALRMMSMQMPEEVLEWLEREMKLQRRSKTEIVRNILLTHARGEACDDREEPIHD